MGRSQLRLRERSGVDSAGDGIRAITFPTISGTAQEGETLTGTNATFIGNPTISIARAWLRNGVAIGGATNATYVVQAGDVGNRITFRNVATSTRTDFPTVTVVSAQTAVVGP
jgi:hypothetical protein